MSGNMTYPDRDPDCVTVDFHKYIFHSEYIRDHPLMATEESDDTERMIFDSNKLIQLVTRECEACLLPDGGFDYPRFELFVLNKVAQLQSWALTLIQRKKFMRHLPDFCLCMARIFIYAKEITEDDDELSSNEDHENINITNTLRDEKISQD